MIAKLIVEGKEFPIEIQDPELQKLLVPQKKTGYKRVESGEEFWCVDFTGGIRVAHEGCNGPDFPENGIYKSANYYSDISVAQNNARADKLMRQLRRFAVEHRKSGLNWSDAAQRKYYIYYNRRDNKIDIGHVIFSRDFGSIYFDTEEAAEVALNTFKDELTWYFTEYKDSL